MVTTMPALDTSAAESAKSLLNGIDYGALIGSPLTAAITAQAMAARSTWEFIQQVGLNTDKDGNKTAVTVTFMYMKDGEMVRLIVPILTIVPIPLIIIDEVDIQFKASINASASQSSTQSSASDVSGSLTGQASLGWGPFSASVSVTASYSSKQDSKATQDSRYSVEYTQQVHVHATQADMPAGLATVLNILSSAASTGSKDGTLKISPTIGTLALTDPNTKQNLQIRVTNANGLVVPQVSVLIKNIPPWVSFGSAPLGQTISGQKSPDITVPTDDKGTVNLLFWIDTVNAKLANNQQPFQLDISAAITASADDKNPITKTGAFPMKVVGVLPPPPSKASITASPSPLTMAHEATTGQTVTIAVTDASGNPAKGGTVAVSVSTNLAATPTSAPIDDKGQTIVTVTPVSGTGAGAGSVTLSYTPDNAPTVTATVPVTLT